MITINDTFANVEEEYRRRQKQFRKGIRSKGSGLHFCARWLDITKESGSNDVALRPCWIDTAYLVTKKAHTYGA